MMRSTYIFLLTVLIFCFSAHQIEAQTGFVVQIDSAEINLTCGDLIGQPEPMWGVDINGTGYQYYPQDGACFQLLPNPQYTLVAPCPGDLPTDVEICFHGFENDPLIPAPASCEISPDCEAVVCQTFTIPPTGQSQSLTVDLPIGGDVTGTLYFTMGSESVSEPVNNDLICDAIDLGPLEFNSFLGGIGSTIYSNYCATNTQEPNPFDENVPGAFINDQGVWFTFETGNDPSGMILIDVKSDPLFTGDEFDAQVAVYRYSNGQCDGTPTLLESVSDNSSFDARLQLTCVEPNTRYYLLVDGGTFGNESIEGPFRLRITDPGVIEGGDLRCDFEDLGVIPEGGIIETDGFRSNFCADDFQDPYVAAFVSQHSVWFSFIAPSSGHVIIDALSDQLIQPLDAQLAIYRTFNGSCTGGLSHVKSQYTDGNPDESMEVTCLFGGSRYFVLVDGSGTFPVGIFKLSVSDGGDITPTNVIDTLICAGEQFRVGPSTYTTTGTYTDTLTIRGGCDSIVITNLTVTDPLIVDFQQTKLAFGEGQANAEARLDVSGGFGDITINWCDGQTGPTATNLIGGTECCVTVTDEAGCIYEECFDIEFVEGVIPIVQDTSVACKGDQNGVITLSARAGLPPYPYTWQSADGKYSGSGTIDSNYQEVLITDLPAGNYIFRMSDIFRDTTFTVGISEPPRLQAQIGSIREITCNSACNGQISANVSGGTPPYTLEWSDGSTDLSELVNRCAGQYTLHVTDANGCQTSVTATLEEPLPFTATAQLVQPVSCYQGSDARIGVNVQNGSAASYMWSNGAATQVQSGLPAGTYQVTVTSDLFCAAVSKVVVTEPAGPLEVEIDVLENISCGGEQDGVLEARVNGAYQDLRYIWSNGTQQATATDLAAGLYTLEIRNENGCTAQDSFLLEEPSLIEARYSTRDITCLDPPRSGAIFIDSVGGGAGGYRFSIDGDQFTRLPQIGELSGGEYELIVQDAAGCERQFPVSIQTPPDFQVSLGPDIIELDLGDSIRLSATASSDQVRFAWDHDARLNGPEAVIAPQVSTSYRVRAEDMTTLCRDEAVVFVQVNKLRRVFIPNAFSPNMDGNNDYFMIYGDNDIVSVASLRVFSREGHLLYERRDFQPNDPVNSWDGYFQGQLLNTGVYVYVAEIEFVDGLTEVFKGDVALIR
jgi:gliding motility-associated-like protein